MSQEPPRDAWFDDLVVRYLDNNLTPDELDEFQRLLAADPARCDTLAECAYHAVLIREYGHASFPELAQLVSPDQCHDRHPAGRASDGIRQRPDHQRGGWRTGNWLRIRVGSGRLTGRTIVVMLTMVAMAGIGLLVAGMNWGLPEFGNGPTAIRIFVERGVARFTHEVTRCSWEPGRVPMIGEPLYPGRYRLVEGTALFLFERGAEVLLDGPAELELVNENCGVLHRGRATAVVPETAIGFRLDTPGSRIIDLGTEFGVEVGPQGTTTLQVYEGEVIARLRDENQHEEPRLVREGEALCLNRSLNTAPFWPERFQRSLGALDDPNRSIRPHNHSRHDTITVLPAVQPLVIDASLSDWDLSGRFHAACEVPFDQSHDLEAAMMYDAQYLYLCAHVGDPHPMRSQMSPSESPTDHARGGGVSLRISTDRGAGWPLTAESVVARHNRPESSADVSDKLSFVVLWYHRPEQKACLQLRHGMDLHGLQLNPPGYLGAFQEDADGRGYTLEYAIPWHLLHAADDPPRGGDQLAAMWLAHWSDAEGRTWQGQLQEIMQPGEQGWNFDRAATWGRALYLP